MVRWPSADIQVKFYGDSPRGTPSSGELNTRGVAKYSDFGPIDVLYACITEPVYALYGQTRTVNAYGHPKIYPRYGLIWSARTVSTVTHGRPYGLYGRPYGLYGSVISVVIFQLQLQLQLWFFSFYFSFSYVFFSCYFSYLVFQLQLHSF